MLIAPPSSFAINSTNNKVCERLYAELGVNPNIKSHTGWERVCYNNKMYIYATRPLTKEQATKLCDCLDCKVPNNEGRNIFYIFKEERKGL